MTHPEHPLESHHRCDHKTLKEQRQTALAARETSIEQSDARNDEPDEESANNEVDVVEFDTSILRVDVDLERIAAPGLGRIELRLCEERVLIWRLRRKTCDV